MPLSIVLSIALIILVVSFFYSSVGQAGASAYLAAMALFNLAPELMKPTALTLNILVASIATVKYYRAKSFSWATFWPFTLTSVPFAFLGGSLMLPSMLYKGAVGVILLFAAYRIYRVNSVDSRQVDPVPIWAGLLSGMVIGFISGLIGVGGGIFLSPLLVMMHWARPRETAGVAAFFILVNSVAGLLGHLSSIAYLPEAIPWWVIAAFIGGWAGSEFGSRRLENDAFRRILAVVMVIAALKMILF